MTKLFTFQNHNWTIFITVFFYLKLFILIHIVFQDFQALKFQWRFTLVLGKVIYLRFYCTIWVIIIKRKGEESSMKVNLIYILPQNYPVAPKLKPLVLKFWTGSSQNHVKRPRVKLSTVIGLKVLNNINVILLMSRH